MCVKIAGLEIFNLVWPSIRSSVGLHTQTLTSARRFSLGGGRVPIALVDRSGGNFPCEFSRKRHSMI